MNPAVGGDYRSELRGLVDELHKYRLAGDKDRINTLNGKIKELVNSTNFAPSDRKLIGDLANEYSELAANEKLWERKYTSMYNKIDKIRVGLFGAAYVSHREFTQMFSSKKLKECEDGHKLSKVLNYLKEYHDAKLVSDSEYQAILKKLIYFVGSKTDRNVPLDRKLVNEFVEYFIQDLSDEDCVEFLFTQNCGDKWQPVQLLDASLSEKAKRKLQTLIYELDSKNGVERGVLTVPQIQQRLQLIWSQCLQDHNSELFKKIGNIVLNKLENAKIIGDYKEVAYLVKTIQIPLKVFEASPGKLKNISEHLEYADFRGFTDKGLEKEVRKLLPEHCARWD